MKSGSPGREASEEAVCVSGGGGEGRGRSVSASRCHCSSAAPPPRRSSRGRCCIEAPDTLKAEQVML